MTELESKILRLVAGKCTRHVTETAFVQASKRDGLYVVSCGWVVPEAFEDDYESHLARPFKSARAVPWVGREVVGIATATEAAEVYEELKSAVFSGRTVVRGDVIGSVSR